MSTPRRRLGTGPTTISSASPADVPPRLLAAERGDPGQLLDDDGHQAAVAPGGRRPLGPGISRD
ncbi:hypothetical protein [Streptomyces sp. CB02115]|uniref:hypothetical protein n=1 Tax=Streptomyces sp. CB02115 TaxID=1703939 RepID=UPI000AECCB8B|nr:hypothetical protein [Streptomyces sp. CB02115]